MACKLEEYGNRGLTHTSKEPSIADIKVLIKNYDEAMDGLGYTRNQFAREAKIITGPHNGLYAVSGWYLALHAKDCCERRNQDRAV